MHTYKLAPPPITNSFQFDQMPIYQSENGRLIINRAVRKMPYGDLCQFMIYRVFLDPRNQHNNHLMSTRADIMKMNQLHIHNDKTKLFIIPTLREKDRKFILKCCGGFFCSPFNTLEYWLISEYSTNTTLYRYMDKNEPFFYDEVLTITYDLLQILSYAYVEFRQSYLHLIPHNIFLCHNPTSPYPQAKISPYAFISSTFPEQDESLYVSPDYAKGIRAELVSVWSFGVIIYRMCTGMIPTTDGNGIITPQSLNLLQNEDVAFVVKAAINIAAERPSVEQLRLCPFIQACRFHEKFPRCDYEYLPKSLLGKGQFGAVMLATRVDTNEFVAIKESVGGQNAYLQKDARAMLCCQCPELVQYLGYFELNYSLAATVDRTIENIQTKHCYLVMEYCNGGNLEEFLSMYPGLLPEIYIRYFLADIAMGLRYLHFVKGLVHRDLKLENFVLYYDGDNNYQIFNGKLIPNLKITDYGFARAILDDQLASEKGTLLFEAPEILRHEHYSSKSDLYSVGVVLYRLTTKAWPFTCHKEYFFQEMANRADLKFPDSIPIDETLKDLMRKLITHEESQRIGWKEFFEHPFVSSSLQMKGKILNSNQYGLHCIN
ncbi:Protein kinase domain containing protein [Entamoeba marina]